MDTLLITRDDLDDDGGYTGAESIDCAGHVEVAADLGTVRVRGFVRAKGRVRCLAGSGIKAGWGIKAGSGIKAGWGIEAGFSIVAKFLSVRLRIFAGIVAWRLPEPSECEVRAEIRSGMLVHGTHVAPTVKS